MQISMNLAEFLFDSEFLTPLTIDGSIRLSSDSALPWLIYRSCSSGWCSLNLQKFTLGANHVVGYSQVLTRPND